MDISDIYYISFPKDRAASRIVVYSLLVIETVQVVLNTWDVFDIFAAGFGDFDNLDHIHMSWFAVPIMTGLGASKPSRTLPQA